LPAHLASHPCGSQHSIRPVLRLSIDRIGLDRRPLSRKCVRGTFLEPFPFVPRSGLWVTASTSMFRPVTAPDKGISQADHTLPVRLYCSLKHRTRKVSSFNRPMRTPLLRFLFPAASADHVALFETTIFRTIPLRLFIRSRIRPDQIRRSIVVRAVFRFRLN